MPTNPWAGGAENQTRRGTVKSTLTALPATIPDTVTIKSPLVLNAALPTSNCKTTKSLPPPFIAPGVFVTSMVLLINAGASTLTEIEWKTPPGFSLSSNKKTSLSALLAVKSKAWTCETLPATRARSSIPIIFIFATIS